MSGITSFSPLQLRTYGKYIRQAKRLVETYRVPGGVDKAGKVLPMSKWEGPAAALKVTYRADGDNLVISHVPFFSILRKPPGSTKADPYQINVSSFYSVRKTIDSGGLVGGPAWEQTEAARPVPMPVEAREALTSHLRKLGLVDLVSVGGAHVIPADDIVEEEALTTA